VAIVTEAAASRVGNFRETIDRLRERATKARRTVSFIVGVLMAVIAGVVTIDLNELRLEQYSSAKSIAATYASIFPSQAALSRKVETLVEKQIGAAVVPANFAPPSKADYDALDQDIKTAIEQFDAMNKTLAGASNGGGLSGWNSIVKTVITNLGAIAFALLFIQVALNFMRYYARLAEQYDGQADALLAADGDTEKAKELLPLFVPSSIDFGKVPVSLAEKTLDTMKDVAAAMRKMAD